MHVQILNHTLVAVVVVLVLVAVVVVVFIGITAPQGRQAREFVEVCGEVAQTLDIENDVFGNGPRQPTPIRNTGTASDFVDNDQRMWGGLNANKSTKILRMN